MKFTSKTLLEKVFDIINKEAVFDSNEIYKNFKQLIEYNLDIDNYYEDEVIEYIEEINDITKSNFSKNDIDKIKSYLISYVLTPKNWKRKSKEKIPTHYKGMFDKDMFEYPYDYYWINKAIDNNFKNGDKVIRRAFTLDYDIFNRDVELIVLTNQDDTEIINFGTIED